MELIINIVKIIVLSIICLVSVVALINYYSKRGRKFEFSLPVGVEIIFEVFGGIFLGMIAFASIMGVLISLAEMGLTTESVYIFMMLAFILVVVLIGVILFYKNKAKRILKERYRTSNKSG